MYRQQTPGMIQTIFGEMTEAQFQTFRQAPMGSPTGHTAERYKEITGRDPVCNVDGFGIACALGVVDLIDTLAAATGQEWFRVLRGVTKVLGLLKESTAPKPYSDANPHPASCYIATNQLKAEREAAKQSG